jgi:hypothetical protein
MRFSSSNSTRSSFIRVRLTISRSAARRSPVRCNEELDGAMPVDKVNSRVG